MNAVTGIPVTHRMPGFYSVARMVRLIKVVRALYLSVLVLTRGIRVRVVLSRIGF